ncbi:MAG: hypothetical protein AAF551_00255, partial [Bacteroidota bacterium]
MKSTYLFAQSAKKWGWFLFIPFLILGFFCWHTEFNFSFLEIDGLAQNLTDELAVTGLILSLLLIGFSKVKDEDEMIHSIRTRSMQIGIYINYALIILATLSVYGFEYINV